MEPVRSNENNAGAAQVDPYQLREEEINAIATVIPTAVLPEDDNFGSQDADGARDFLQLCTGEELPPMSLRQSKTREMLISQFPTLPPVVPPIVDNFQELNLEAINTPLFKRPLGASTPCVQVAVPELQLPMPMADLQEFVPVEVVPENRTEESIPLVVPVSAESNAEPTGRPVVESSSSEEAVPVPVQRTRRPRREVALTQRLEPFESTPRATARPRRNFDIFSFPYRTVWNKTIQDVQSLLQEMYQQQQLRTHLQELSEVPVMREATTNQKVDSGFGQTTNERSRNLQLPMSTTETSNLADNRTDDKVIVALDEQLRDILNQQHAIVTSDLAMSVQPNHLESVDGKLAEASDGYQLPMVIGDTPVNIEADVMNKPSQTETAVSVLQETEKIASTSAVPVPDQQEQPTKRISRKRAD
uniref:Uncharacterized protein n=1 Tax=Anopheles epiroticus TaxID=199890 RepID=A0A182PKU3_9DIPT